MQGLPTIRPVAVTPAPLIRTALPVAGRGRPLQRTGATTCTVPPVTVEPLPGVTLNYTRRQREEIMAAAHSEEEKLPGAVIQANLISIFDKEELKKMAVCEINNPADKGPNTVNDPRLCPPDDDSLCDTCHKDIIECPGHLGYIKLNRAIYHPLYIRTIVQVLNCVCSACGGLLLTRQELKERGLLKKTGPNRLKLIEEASEKINKCATERLGQPRPENTRPCTRNPFYFSKKDARNKQIWYRYKTTVRGEKEREEMKPIQEVEKILQAISPEDAELLGFKNGTHPLRMILWTFPVIPRIARPNSVQDGAVLQDHLTSMYMDIIKDNANLLTAKTEDKQREALENLFFHIEHFIDNTDGKYSRGHRGEYKSIKERIIGKEELIRGMLMGKRVNYSARTVVSPDPSLKFGQIRIPRSWAPVLTQAEDVTTFNEGRLTDLLRLGHITHITRGSGPYKGRRFKVLEHTRATEVLSIGDKVDRWLQDGDYILFNRQPTVHKQGFMGAEVVLGDEETIGIHLGYTTPLNADFELKF